MSSLPPSSVFNRPLLIYDDRCYSCTKFAKIVAVLSRGWIRTSGHYYSQEARKAKSMIFPPGYDPTKMFWLVNSSGAFGARSGLPQVAKEIIAGALLRRGFVASDNVPSSCGYSAGGISCYGPADVLARLARLLSHGKIFRFN